MGAPQPDEEYRSVTGPTKHGGDGGEEAEWPSPLHHRYPPPTLPRSWQVQGSVGLKAWILELAWVPALAPLSQKPGDTGQVLSPRLPFSKWQ